MQYRKQNFTYNFITAQAVDQTEAWEIILSELNDLVLDEDFKVKTILALTASGVPVNDSSTARDLSNALFTAIHKDAATRGILVHLMELRGADPYVGAQGGIYDKPAFEGTATNATEAFERLVSAKQPEMSTEEIKGYLLQDLANKQKMRGIAIPFSDKVKNADPAKIALVLLGSVLLIYGITKLFKK